MRAHFYTYVRRGARVPLQGMSTNIEFKISLTRNGMCYFISLITESGIIAMVRAKKVRLWRNFKRRF